MAPQMLGIEGSCDQHDEYTIHDHGDDRFEWTDIDLTNSGYIMLGEEFCPDGDIPCYCYLREDGSHAMLLMVDDVCSVSNEISLLTVIDLKLQEVDNEDEQGNPSPDLSADKLLKVYGVIATDYREEGIGSGRYLALELYSRIIKHDSRVLTSDHQQYPPGRRIWECLPAKLQEDGTEARIQIYKYSELKLLKNGRLGYRYDTGLVAELNTNVNTALNNQIWGLSSSFEDILLIAKAA